MKSINDIIGNVISAEGGCVNNPNDPRRATKYGITETVAQANGYKGEMQAKKIC